MNITGLFIRRPVMTVLVVSSMVFFGILGYFKLPVSYLPEVEYPTIQITASNPGSSPETMAATVATPLEKQFAQIQGVASMSSVNVLGKSTITIQFSMDRNIDGCAMDVQSAITAAGAFLPKDMPNPPSFLKVNPADVPIFYISLSSESLPIYVVNDYANTFLTDSISMVNGVSQVLIYGQAQFAVRVRINPDKMAAKGVSLNEVQNAITSANVNKPVGTLEGKTRTYTIQATGQLVKADEYKDIIVAYREDRPVFLHEIAEVIDDILADKTASYVNGKRNLTLAITKQAGSNTVNVVRDIKKILPGLQEQLPAGINMEILYDRTEGIIEAVKDVQFTLVVAIGLVVAVVYIFLRNAAATLIAGISIPISIIFTFAGMYKLGFSLDNLSLMALTLSVGFVVDDAIVMLENVVRHMEMGKKPYVAAVEGSKEITFTVISMTSSLAVVFIPIMYMAGIVGRILSEFATTITVAIIVSGIVSLTLTPMMCSRMLRPGKSIAGSDPFFDALLGFYKRTLSACMRHRPTVMMAFAGILVATAALFVYMPKGFLPTDDLSYLKGVSVASEGISFESLSNHLLELQKVMGNDPNVKNGLAVVGMPTSNQGIVIPFLKGPKERKLNADSVAWEMTPKLNSVPGVKVFVQNPPMIVLTGKQTMNLYQFTLTSPDSKALFKAAPAFVEKMTQLPELIGVVSDLMMNNPELLVTINRDKASALGVSASAIENSLYSAYGERQISTIYGETDQYYVILEVLRQFQKQAEDLPLLYVENSKGELIRLDSVADISFKRGPLQVNHTGQLSSVTVSYNTKPDVSLGQANDAISKLAAKELPASVTTFFEGTAGQFDESIQSVYFLVFLAIAIIYVILGSLYESYIHPLTIISGLPSAAFGGLLTLLVFGKPLDLYAIVGVIMLIGIVKKNAIMVVDFAIENEKMGKTAAEASFDGAIERFRPIMMTTVAALFGALPIAMGIGAGAEARQPMGLAVVGGLILSQIVTLYLTPVFYTYMDQLQKYLDRNKAKKMEILGIPAEEGKE